MPEFAIDFTARSYDADGRLHISRSHITKAAVNPYYGREIPRAESLGLDPNKVYYLLRAPEEIAKAAPTFERLPILSKHTPVDVFWDEGARKQFIVGTIGSNVEFLDPYLDADVSIWDADAIAGIETDQVREFSCGYRYVPVMTTGTFHGQKYDGIMTEIQGNHMALVEAGRAGSDVLAADQTPGGMMKETKLGKALRIALTTAFPKVVIAEDSELGKLLAGATRKGLDRPKATSLIIAMDAELKSPTVTAVMDALADVDDPEPSKKTNEKEEGAKDACSCDAKDGKHAKDCKMGKDEDEDEEDEKKRAAKDKKAKDENMKAMDAKLDDLRAQYREADIAKRDVRPVVGDILAMDSAADIYEFALDHMKVKHDGVTGAAALKALFDLAKDRHESAPVVVAMDAAATTSRFKNLGRFTRA